MFKIIDPRKFHTRSAHGGSETIQLAGDSDATERVAPEPMAISIPTMLGAASTNGVEYEVANSATIPNEGEKTFNAFCEEGQEQKALVHMCHGSQGVSRASKVVILCLGCYFMIIGAAFGTTEVHK